MQPKFTLYSCNSTTSASAPPSAPFPASSAPTSASSPVFYSQLKLPLTRAAIHSHLPNCPFLLRSVPEQIQQIIEVHSLNERGQLMLQIIRGLLLRRVWSRWLLLRRWRRSRRILRTRGPSLRLYVRHIFLIALDLLPKHVVAFRELGVEVGVGVAGGEVGGAEKAEVGAAGAGHVVAAVGFNDGGATGGAGSGVVFDVLFVCELSFGECRVGGAADEVVAVP